MELNHEKVDEITLALLYLTTFKDKHGLRAWKSHDWDVLNRLHERGYIHDPATKSDVGDAHGGRRSAPLYYRRCRFVFLRRCARCFATGLVLKFHGWRKIAMALIDRLVSQARDNAMLAM